MLPLMSGDFSSIDYGPVPPNLQAMALSLLISQEPPDEKAGRLKAIIASTRDQADPFSTLLAATDGPNVVGAGWGQRLPGQTALIWPPRVIDDRFEELTDRLQEELDIELAAKGVQIAQTLLPNIEDADARRLIRCGYEHAADLLYLVSVVGRERAEDSSGELDFEPFREDQRLRLEGLVERTYVGSLDVPALDGKRDINDVLDGYQQTGEFAPERWLFVRANGKDVGCLLLADHPELQQCELVYMGIVPEARGNGFGADVTAHAQTLARRARRERLVLAVDASNDPAIVAYVEAGFVEWFRRAVLLKSFSSAANLPEA